MTSEPPATPVLKRPRKARCEASGVWAPANADGRATCPLCDRGIDRTKAGRLWAHVRRWPRPMTLPEALDKLQGIRRS